MSVWESQISKAEIFGKKQKKHKIKWDKRQRRLPMTSWCFIKAGPSGGSAALKYHVVSFYLITWKFWWGNS